MSSGNFLFILVSGICLIIHNAIMIAGDEMHVHFLVGIFLSFIVVSITGFILHSKFSFNQPLSIESFMRYEFAMALNIPLVTIVIWFWYSLLGLAMIWSAPISTACMVLVNFLLSRWAIVKQPRSIQPRKQN